MSDRYSLPLLADHHSHPLLYAALMSAVDLSNVRHQEHALDLINQSSRLAPLVVAHGWKDSFFSFDRSALESLPAVAIFNLSLHNLLVNASGRKILADAYGDQVLRLNDREWYEANLRVVLNWFAMLNGSAAALHSFYEHLETLGIWSAEEMLLVSEQEIEWFDEAELSDRTRFWAAPDTYDSLSQSGQARVHGIKLFTDGALGVRTAALNQPYADDPARENRGMLVYTDPQLERAIASAAEIGKSIAIHAIGDRAIEQTLQSLENMGPRIDRFHQVRIEHAQMISVEAAQRAKRLGVILSMQPNFNSDSRDYADRLGPDYARQNNPFRMLIDDVGFQPGIDLILGSDGMPHGAKEALSQSLHPVYESQQLTLEEFLAAYAANIGSFEVEL